MTNLWKKFFGKVLCNRTNERQADSQKTQVMIVAGLGNPGKAYDGTRHNAGFDVVDALAKLLGTEIKTAKFGGLLGEARVEDKKLILLKPQKYMNLSGEVVATAAGFYKLAAGNVFIVTDDMSLEAGRIRIRAKGSAGGHNGLTDVILKLGTDEVARLRIGIGAAEGTIAHDYVLSRPNGQQRQLLDKAVERACQAILCWAKEGVEAAMNKFNIPAAE